ncbi:hypothetical protein NGM33_23840 [Nocardiopsis dassonvillei]|uniref:hypothetical protein n=1 Tax=Nocardiopsis dassonvillei TaxID=2014 RepID=UPI0020A593F2|nr:hypothetical protein [Nocardiopsis dassonvillei]MCP3016364.1 hypothetical protein [Nocardiopsis dassonvillei]
MHLPTTVLPLMLVEQFVGIAFAAVGVTAVRKAADAAIASTELSFFFIFPRAFWVNGLMTVAVKKFDKQELLKCKVT